MDVEFIRYQFEDGHYGVITKNGLKIGVRHLQMMYMLASSIAVGIMRGSLGVAVLATNDQSRINDTYIQIHSWDGRIQGAVLSSFFIGYAAMLVPSEVFFKRIGGKMLTTVMLIVNGALCVAMPTIINKGGWVAACNANLIMGMSHSCFYTANHELLDVWLPPSERKIFNYLIYGGVQIGIIVGLNVSGILSALPLGWELIYYALAMMSLSLGVISATLTASSPEDHQAVGDVEIEFIKESLTYYRKKDLRKPYREILTSPQFWAVTCVHAASNALFLFCIVYAPAYVTTFGISLQDSAWYCMFPFIAMAAVYFVVGPIIEWVYRIKYFHYIFSSSFMKKFINGLGALGIVIGLTLVANAREWSCPPVILLAAILALLGFQLCGFLSTYNDMSENFSGTMMMLSATFSSVFGGSMIFVYGVILGDNMMDPFRWRAVFITLASLYVVCTVIYTILGSSERQYWDHVNDKKSMGHFNGAIDVNQVQLEEAGHKTYISHKEEIDTAL
ncbi:putative inorganic phosphate cotransporter [Anticarsia gemmatalis]|uniref:putative inorganic phosphate cotransporter n=1 Tax=Anticarsia gemmatalis TaxID=129554 RepID=UPI003F7694EF